MKCVALALLIGCGAPANPSSPSIPPPIPAQDAEPARQPDKPPDPTMVITEDVDRMRMPPVPEPAAPKVIVPAPDGPTKVGEIVGEPQIEGKGSGNKEEPADEVEDGITVKHVKAPIWCLKGAKINACAATIGGCAALAKSGGQCVKATSWACTWWKVRTSGQQKILCLSTFGQCDAVGEVLNRDSEVSDLKACIIFRTP